MIQCCQSWTHVLIALTQEVIERGSTGVSPPGKSSLLGKEELDSRRERVYRCSFALSLRKVCSFPRGTPAELSQLAQYQLQDEPLLNPLLPSGWESSAAETQPFGTWGRQRFLLEKVFC